MLQISQNCPTAMRPPNFYVEIKRDYYIAALAPDELTLAKWLRAWGDGLFRLWTLDEDAVRNHNAELRRPFELQAEEWWLG